MYKLIRCFYADHIPYAIEISFVPTGPYPDLSANDIEKQGLYKSMQMYNIIPEHASENIFAVKLTNEDALILGLKPQDIAIQIERTTHSNNRIIEFTTSLIKQNTFITHRNLVLHKYPAVPSGVPVHRKTLRL